MLIGWIGLLKRFRAVLFKDNLGISKSILYCHHISHLSILATLMKQKKSCFIRNINRFAIIWDQF